MFKTGIMAPVLVLCLAQGTMVANVNHIYSFLAACESYILLFIPRLPTLPASKDRTSLIAVLNLLHIGVEPTQVSKQTGIGEALEAVSEIAILSIVCLFHLPLSHIT